MEDEVGRREPREWGPSEADLRELEQGPQGGQEGRHEPHEAASQAVARREQGPKALR